LKVLYALLEPNPYKKNKKINQTESNQIDEVSVVGISNWRLDNSKSSRVLLVQRPKFDLDNLVETANRLLGSSKINKTSLRDLAEAYSEYEANGQTKFPYFHGLHDYYALIKNLSIKGITPENIHLALARNFGDIKEHTENCLKYFKPIIDAFNGRKSWTYNPIPIDTLINENLESEGSRHLMVIGKSDSIINILTYQLREMNLDPVIIFGSQFSDDRDDYSYSMWSRIMVSVTKILF